ncbi:MAG: Gfo/Idh/MocA family oxidoreductase [Spirochaetes bacterium]|nr:Gfo/Idh/MocA family oxidoreductase [Spirochaetota bacterium]
MGKGVAIRGAGQVAYQYASAVTEDPLLTLIGVSSRTQESAARLVKQYASYNPSKLLKVYPSYEALLQDSEVEVVILCMPNYLHAREASLALEAGKHLILEKPPVITYEEMESLWNTYKRVSTQRRVYTVVSFVLRWHPLIRTLRSLLDRRVIGDVYYTEMDYWHGIKPSFSSYPWIRKQEYAGGSMITGGCHAVDLARYLKGEVKEVFAYSYRQREDFDYPTTVVGALRFQDESVGKVSASLDGVSFPYQFNIDLLGSEGAIRGNKLYSSVLFPSQDRWVELPCTTPDSGSVSHHPFKEEVHEFSRSLSQGKPIQPDLKEGLRSMEVALAITESARTGKPIQIGKLSFMDSCP